MNTDNREELQRIIGTDYKLQWVIGHGGMSTVWLADDPDHDREVAIKVLRPEFSANEEFLTRFRNEAHAAEGINSENVVATYDYREVPSGEGYDMCFIVMEYIRGESVADLIHREGYLEESVALDILEQAAHGLSVIHEMGLVHRDIKPGNLMLTQNGKVKITDFGIAKAASAVPLTRTGMVVGTAQYVSPEQAQGQPVDAATDVYSLGVVGYELLSGKRPFTGDSSVSIALAHVSNNPPPLSTGISAPTRELISIALRKDPATRFADGTEFQHAIADARAGRRPTKTFTAAAPAPAPQPGPSTAELASVAHALSHAPAVAPAQSQASAPAPAPAKKSGGFGTGVLIALFTLVAALGAVWAYTSGALDGLLGDEPTSSSTTPTSETVTETTKYTTITEQPTSARHEPTTRSEPSTLYNTPESETTRAPEDDHQSPTHHQPTHTSEPAVPSQPHAPTPAPNPIPDFNDVPGLPDL